jgi:cytosine/adenosine deaminase-related metal-dependent hydrolase
MVERFKGIPFMRLTGARIAAGPASAPRRDISVRRGRLHFDAPRLADERELDLSGHLVLPGLINAHDHLEFNLFPRLGQRLYSNAFEWAAEIYKPDASPVREQLTIPRAVRLAWGGLRNLLSGVTTVAHHNPYDASVFDERFPVRVLRRFGWAHSLDFSPDLRARFRQTPKDQPFIVHAAEGTDSKAAAEIFRLERLGVLDSRTVLVHALAIGRPEIELLLSRRCAIVWCPGSNLSMFGSTLSREILDSGVPIALGTDSALSFAGDLADELRCAHTHGVARDALYGMVTSGAARVLRLRDGRGWLREGGVADLIAVEDRGQSPAEALLELQPRLVMIHGRLRLLSKDFNLRTPFHHIHVEGRGSFLADVDVPSLHAETAKVLGSEYRLAGKRVAA